MQFLALKKVSLIIISKLNAMKTIPHYFQLFIRPKVKVSVLFLLMVLVSCQPILRKIYGIKQPEIENSASIKKKALKYNLDTANIITVNSKDYPYVLKGQGIPDAAIYDKNGNYIEYRQTDTSCNAGLFQFIPELSLTNQYNKPSKANLKQELVKFRGLKGETISAIDSADFFMLIYWTVFVGKLNKDHVKVWEDMARENKKCKIKVLKVNLDLQEYWDVNERQKIIQAMKKKK